MFVLLWERGWPGDVVGDGLGLSERLLADLQMSGSSDHCQYYLRECPYDMAASFPQRDPEESKMEAEMPFMI